MITQFLNWLANQNLEETEVRHTLAQQILDIFVQEDTLFNNIPPEYRSEERHLIFTQLVLLFATCLQIN